MILLNPRQTNNSRLTICFLRQSKISKPKLIPSLALLTTRQLVLKRMKTPTLMISIPRISLYHPIYHSYNPAQFNCFWIRRPDVAPATYTPSPPTFSPSANPSSSIPVYVPPPLRRQPFRTQPRTAPRNMLPACLVSRSSPFWTSQSSSQQSRNTASLPSRRLHTRI